jgi:exopolysaccharide biosynthesis WecB/TagA/CpsF family protein
MHVAFYLHDLSGGGVERMRLALMDALRARGVVVTLVLGARRGPLVPLLPADLPVVELGRRRMLGAVGPLVRFLRTIRPDVLVASLDHNNITALLAGRLAGAGGSVVICQHNALSAERASGWRYRAVPWLYWLLQSSAAGVVAVSRGVADDLAATAGIPRRRIRAIYNPVIGPDFAARAQQPAPHPWLVECRCPVFIFAGRLTAQKDPGMLLDAMALLLRQRAARLILLGEGHLLPALQAQATQLGIAHAIAFVGFQANPLPWIRAAHALVCSSRYEGLGNVIIEALGCGTPVIATDCPHGPAEILGGGAFGRLVPVGDAAALAAAMAAQACDVPDRHRLRARAGYFTASSCAEAHLALFSDILTVAGRRISALGLSLSPLRAEQVIERIVTGPAPARVELVVTPNIQHVRLLRRHDFAAAYAGACLVCPDGFPVLLYARWRGLGLRGRVTGCDLFHRLLRHPGIVRQSLFLVVESQSTFAAASAWAGGLGPEQRIRIALAPPGLAGDLAAQLRLADAIRAAAPSLLVVTLGAPLSEVFVHRHRHVLPPCWALCLGQAVRVELGLTRRAPGAWHRFGLEWLWRIGQEPRRLTGRYGLALAWLPVAILRDLGGRMRS